MSVMASVHRDQVQAFRFAALGCSGRIRVAGVSRAQAEAFIADAVGWLRDMESRLTRFSDDSLIGQLNRAAGHGGVRADAELLAVLDAAERAWKTSDGRLDATVLPLMRLWHDPERQAWPTAAELAAARALVNWRTLWRSGDAVALPRVGMALDLGGVGKEWAVDRLIALAVRAGIADCLVELGGDCAARGHQPAHRGWWVALPGAAAALELRDEALATSGVGARRRVLAGRVIPHLIDARSGLPASGVVRSVTVLARDCLSAGIHATDACLVEYAQPDLLAARAGGLPLWGRAADGRLLADPRLLARVHPISERGEAA